MITFAIFTPEGELYNDKIDKVTIPTRAGAITVLPEHMPLITVLRPGELNIHKGNAVINLSVSSGVAEIRPDSQVYIMADTAERAEDIDIERAQAARKRAEELLAQEESAIDMDFAMLQAKIEKELARVSVGKKYKNLKIHSKK